MKVSSVVLAAVASAGLAGCSVDASVDADRPAVTSSSPAVAVSGPPASTFAPMQCGTPSDSVVRRVLDVFAVGDGSVTASTLVPAVSTDSGDWFIVGLDQDIQVGDGTIYPDRSVRALAVTDADVRHAKIIRLGGTVAGGGISWRRVNWTGATLEQGKRAVSKAASCLDDGR